MRMKKYEITDIAHPDNPNLHRITESVLKGSVLGQIFNNKNFTLCGP